MSVTLVEGGDLEKLKTWSPPSDKFSNRVVSLTNTTKSFLESGFNVHRVITFYSNLSQILECGSMSMEGELANSRTYMLGILPAEQHPALNRIA
jgi:hypothetical protein